MGCSIVHLFNCHCEVALVFDVSETVFAEEALHIFILKELLTLIFVNLVDQLLDVDS